MKSKILKEDSEKKNANKEKEKKALLSYYASKSKKLCVLCGTCTEQGCKHVAARGVSQSDEESEEEEAVEVEEEGEEHPEENQQEEEDLPEEKEPPPWRKQAGGKIPGWNSRKHREDVMEEGQEQTEEMRYATKWFQQYGDDKEIPRKFTPCKFYFKSRGCLNKECLFSHNEEIFGREPFVSFFHGWTWERKERKTRDEINNRGKKL